MKPRTARITAGTALALSILTIPVAPATASAQDVPAYTNEQVRPPTPDRSPGCGTAAPQEPGDSVQHGLASGGLNRSYRLHLPEGYSGRKAWPVVLAFHGRGNDGTRTEEFSKLSELPAIVAYPEGVVGTGDGNRQAWQGAPYSAPGVDDVAFTRDLLDELEADLCLDRRRVYATGKSNGGGFTGILACTASDRITAIAPVAGAFYPSGIDCDPQRPVPVVEFHGTADATIPYAGDADRDLPAVAEWTGAWAERNDCRSAPLTRRVEPDISVSDWFGCDRAAGVQHVAIDGGGHTWPGADVNSGGGATTQTIEAHEVLWRFLSPHRMPVR